MSVFSMTVFNFYYENKEDSLCKLENIQKHTKKKISVSHNPTNLRQSCLIIDRFLFFFPFASQIFLLEDFKV